MRLAILFAVLGLGACTTSAGAAGDYVCKNAPGIANAQGAVHSAGCLQNSDCKYGVCNKVALQLSGHVTTTEGVCSKDCSCGGPTSQCSADDDEANGLHFTCIKAASGGGSECALKCTSVADCQKVNPRFTACSTGSVTFSTAVKVCTIN